MGWWHTGIDEDVIGDDPADAVHVALARMADRCDEQGLAKPTIAQLVRALERELRERQDQYLSDGDRPIGRLVVQARSADKTTVQDCEAEAQAAVRELLQALRTIYEQQLDRRPRLSEILHALTFVLADQPEQFLTHPSDVAIDAGDIREEPT